ncbi:GrpB family protein [Halorussus aquaticus]|uniref:GrpB family protein n=1 Tax=Halorussus aquaticus TaxID=2953748 RepID=A0ABD5Q2B7_9EURY|nr:GrpB family protein [Halorussus aquaticus]
MADVTIEIVDYDPAWPVRFEREADRMAEILGDRVVSIEHIGSTAVPGLAAKPIVDIVPVVADVDDGEVCARRLAEAGYYRSHKDRGDDWIELGREADDGQEFNVHIRPRDSERLRRNLLLRDYLRDHPDAHEEYARVKREAAAKHPEDPDAYTRAKSAVIESILGRAREAGYEPDI